MELGSIVEHILSKDWLLVIEDNDSKVLCRKKDLQLIELFKFEVKLR